MPVRVVVAVLQRLNPNSGFIPYFIREVWVTNGEMEEKQRKKGLRDEEYTEVGFCRLRSSVLGHGRNGDGRSGRGTTVFAEKKCITCHTLGDQKGAATQLGRSLDHVGANVTRHG